MNIGLRLRRVRLSKKLSQAEMADILGLSTQQAYAAYEKKEVFNLETIKKWNKILKVDLMADDFIETDEEYQDILNENDQPQIQDDVENKDIYGKSAEAILRLIEINKSQSETNRLHAEARIKESENNSRLITLIEAKEKKSNWNAGQEMIQALLTKQHVFQEFVLDLFAKQQGMSTEEFHAVWGKKLSEHVPGA